MSETLWYMDLVIYKYTTSKANFQPDAYGILWTCVIVGQKVEVRFPPLPFSCLFYSSLYLPLPAA